jgi:hypothetical protein
MTPITERSENLIRMAYHQQSILGVAFVDTNVVRLNPSMTSSWPAQPKTDSLSSAYEAGTSNAPSVEHAAASAVLAA